MRDELNDALNEITLLTRIRNEEKRISSERYMQLCAAESQLSAGKRWCSSMNLCALVQYWALKTLNSTVNRDLNASRKELRFSTRDSAVARNLSSEVCSTKSCRNTCPKNWRNLNASLTCWTFLATFCHHRRFRLTPLPSTYLPCDTYFVCKLMNDISFRLNHQKTKHAEELHKSARSIATLDEEVRQVLSKENLYTRIKTICV